MLFQSDEQGRAGSVKSNQKPIHRMGVQFCLEGTHTSFDELPVDLPHHGLVAIYRYLCRCHGHVNLHKRHKGAQEIQEVNHCESKIKPSTVTEVSKKNIWGKNTFEASHIKHQPKTKTWQTFAHHFEFACARRCGRNPMGICARDRLTAFGGWGHGWLCCRGFCSTGRRRAHQVRHSPISIVLFHLFFSQIELHRHMGWCKAPGHTWWLHSNSCVGSTSVFQSGNYSETADGNALSHINYNKLYIYLYL